MHSTITLLHFYTCVRYHNKDKKKDGELADMFKVPSAVAFIAEIDIIIDLPSSPADTPKPRNTG